MDIDLLSEEAKSGKHQALMDKAVTFAVFLDYLEGDYNYSNLNRPKSLANPEINNPGDSTDEAMAFLANMVKEKIDNEVKVYFELLPYLQKFEEKLEIDFNKQQRKGVICIFRVGMGLALLENLSGLNIERFCHPSISNVLQLPFLVLENMKKHGFECDMNFLGDKDTQKALIQLALYVGYFQGKYSGESPSSVLEFVTPMAK